MSNKPQPIPQQLHQQSLPFVHPDNALSTPEEKPTISLYSQSASEADRAIRQLVQEFDHTKFYWRSSDARGHTSTIKTRIPPYWDNAIQYLIDNVKAYKCRSDFFRDAIVHRIVFLVNSVNTIDPHELAVLLTEIESEKAITDGIAFDKARATAEKGVRSCLKRKDYKAALHLIGKIEVNAHNMEEVYRVRLLRICKKYRERIRKLLEDREAGL